MRTWSYKRIIEVWLSEFLRSILWYNRNVMENINIEKIAQKLGLKESQVSQVLDLTAEGNTIPFIARYRKEMTGNLDEVEINGCSSL